VAVPEKPREKVKKQPKSSAKEAEAKAQVQPIIEAAERAATTIIAEAEAKAARYVEESRQRTEEIAGQHAQHIWTLTDALIARAEAVKRQSDELLHALTQTRRGAEAAMQASPGSNELPPSQAVDPPVYGGRPAEEVPRGRATPPPRAPAAGSDSVGPAATQPSAPSRPAAPEPPPPSPPGQPSEGARLLATQMAVAGSSRDEITSRLRNDFGIGDAESMLDSILGVG